MKLLDKLISSSERKYLISQHGKGIITTIGSYGVIDIEDLFFSRIDHVLLSLFILQTLLINT